MISAQNVNISENASLNLASYINCLNHQIFAISNEYDNVTQNFVVSFMSTYTGGKYFVYTSTDGSKYELIGTTAEGSFDFSVSEPIETLYIKATQTFDNGFSLDSNTIKMTADEENRYVCEYTDTDKDGLIDFYEHIFGSDIYIGDTDGDGLSDYIEVMLIGTDPLYTDSDEDGTNDGDEDYDCDKLTNISEVINGTNLTLEDTDKDSLTDYDEIHVYNTNPLKYDTDDDDIGDGDEIALGLDPLSGDSDGNGVPDNAEKINQTFTHEVENEDCAVNKVIINSAATGNLQSTMTVESVMDADVLCSNVVGLVGEPFEINTTSEFDEAVITFKINPQKLGEAEFDNLLFLWYDEENDVFRELTTVIDEENCTVSTTTAHFSRYMVVDSAEWYKAWGTELEYKLADREPVSTVLAIDCSASMKERDPITFSRSGKAVCARITAAQSFINFMGDGDKLAIVTFGETAEVEAELTNERDVLWDATYTVDSSGDSTRIIAAIQAAVKELEKDKSGNKRVINILTDGISPMSYEFLEIAVPDDIVINTIAFGEDTDDEMLKKVADYTGGEFFKAKKSKDIIEWVNNVGFMKQFDQTDSDGDGIPDTFETGGMKISTGQIIYTNPDKADTDGDDIPDGKEIIYNIFYIGGPTQPNENYISRGLLSGYYFKMVSDPTKYDTDGDYICDGSNDVLGNGMINDEEPLFTISTAIDIPDYYENSILFSHLQEKDERLSTDLRSILFNDGRYAKCATNIYCVKGKSYSSEYLFILADDYIANNAIARLTNDANFASFFIKNLDLLTEVMGDPNLADLPIPIGFASSIYSFARSIGIINNPSIENDLRYFELIYKMADGKTPLCIKAEIWGTGVFSEWVIIKEYLRSY